MEILRGIGASSYIGVGKVRKIESCDDVSKIKKGEIVVVPRASRDMVFHLQRAGGVVTDFGGITSHIAITLRELRIPCIVGTENASEILEEGMIITVDGKTGHIYEGFIEIESHNEFYEVYNPATKIKVNLNVPEIAQQVAPLCDGVGSIRIEFIITRTLKHPHLLLEEGKLTNTIINGIMPILDAFYPKPVWFRTFDIPTDELIHLKGGYDEYVESPESNPLLGLRGIQQDLNNRQILEAEFEAIKYLYDEGYGNIGLKIPFVRDISEYILAKKILRKVGLKPHQDIDVGVSVETPSVVYTLDDFIKEGMDFVTLGMSDLTMCTLAVDRRGVKVAKHFDLMHPAVLKMVELTIKKCNQAGIESAICGHAGSDETIVKKLVEFGISSISTNPDQILKIRKIVYNAENRIILDSNR
jgi:pyruvate, water dikinase